VRKERMEKATSSDSPEGEAVTFGEAVELAIEGEDNPE
jgi:hypothetical protein